MISALRRLLSELSASDPAPLRQDDYRLAAAALLYHAIAIDGSVSPEERARLGRLLSDRYELESAETDRLIEQAMVADQEAVDLYGFTSVLKRHLDDAGREQIVRMMWDLVFADGKVHEFEDNLIWRVAELLGVSSQARIRIKQSVRGNAGE
jgi:uncharacterized tellurite resistance protein B-like protein